MTQPTPEDYPLKAWGVEFCTEPDDGHGFKLNHNVFDRKEDAEAFRSEGLSLNEEHGLDDKYVVVELTIDRVEVSA